MTLIEKAVQSTRGMELHIIIAAMALSVIGMCAAGLCYWRATR